MVLSDRGGYSSVGMAPPPGSRLLGDLAGLLPVCVALTEDLDTLLGASLVHLLVCGRKMTLGQCFSMGVSSAS